MNKAQVWILQSPCFTRSGYGDWAMSIAKSLLRYSKKTPIDLMIAPTPWGHCSQKNMEEEQKDPESKELIDRILKGPVNAQPDVFIQMTIPNEFQAPAKYNIVMTAVIDTTVSRPEWIEGLNRMNLNIVTSIHSMDVFARASYAKKDPNGTSSTLVVNKTMEVLAWGANTSIFKKTTDKIQSLESMMSVPEDFGFLFVGQWTSGNMASDRKAIGFLIKTFLESFMDISNPPCLFLKTSGAQISVIDKYDCLTKIKEVTEAVQSQFPKAKLPNVYLIHGELTEEEMNGLYNHDKVKVHVSFTHGEGFGHPLLLSTLSGKPLLAPHWSGHLDFLNPSYSKFFEGDLKPIPAEAVNEWFVKEAQWFDVNYDQAGKTMRNYFHHYGGKMLVDAELLRAENAKKFSLESMDEKFHAMLDKYVPKFIPQQSIVLSKLRKLDLPKLKKLNPSPMDPIIKV